MPAVLKVKCKDQVYRVPLQDEKPTYEDVMAAIQKLYPIGRMIAKYVDDENDMCTLCTSSFSDFLTHATEHNGHKIWKLDVILPETTRTESRSKDASNNRTGNALPTDHANFLHDARAGESPLANVMRFAKGTLRTFAGKGLSKGMHGVCRGHLWKPGPKRVMFALLQMQRNNALNSKALAALIIQVLPEMHAHVASHAEKVDWKLGERFFEEVRPAFEDLRILVSGTVGLEHCAGKIGDVIERKIPPSEALLETLSALDMIPFDMQVAFLEALYACQEGRLQKWLKRTETTKPWIPTIPLTHWGITCDGCNQNPIQGLRFKCNACPDFDLCAECFTSKGALHDGECSAHEFELMLAPSSRLPWAPLLMRHGKGKGKGKGKCKGKDKNFGKRKFFEALFGGVEQPIQACARKGCNYAATWHPTHCCAAGQHGGVHGGRCEQTPIQTPAAEEEGTWMQEEPLSTQMFDFRFPVLVEDGRNLTIQWNKNEDPQQVAQRFALRHGIPQEELSTIKAFVVHAVSIRGATNRHSEVAGAGAIAEDAEVKTIQEQLAKAQIGSIDMEAHAEESQQPSKQHGKHEHIMEINDEELPQLSNCNHEK